MKDINMVDRFALLVNPEWAYQRLVWRQSVEAMRSYDAGNSGRLNSGWTRVNSSAQQTDKPFRDSIRARARDLERNSDLAEGIVLAYQRNVVGRGFRLQCMIKNSNGEDNEPLNTTIEDLWKEWSRSFNCDLTKQQTLTEMVKMAMRRIRYDGGIIFIKVYTDGGILPFKLQAREVDELDLSVLKPQKSADENVIIDGIEFDPYHRPVAYYFKTYTADGFWVGGNERVEARRVIYLWEKRRPSQVREMSPMANSLTRIRDTNEYMTAVSVQARILACLSVFIKKQNPAAGFGRQTAPPVVDASSGYNETMLSPGMIHNMQPGDDAQFLNPAGQAQNSNQHVSLLQRIFGGGQGLSYEATSRDMSQVNYSSARQGLLEDKRSYQDWQDYLIDHFFYEVFSEFMAIAVMSGLLPIKPAEFFNNKPTYTRHKFITSGWDWIDPKKEADANQTGLNTGQTTLAEVAAGKGGDWRENITQRSKELKFAESLGVSLEGGAQKVEQVQTDANGDLIPQ